MLTNSLKISDQAKAGCFQLNLPRIHGKIRKEWRRTDLSSVWNPLTRCLSNGVLKQDLLDV